MNIRINNTLTGKKEDFVPSKKGKLKMYVCGPTVYNYIHIGNARVYVVFDVVRRFFEWKGYEVTYVSNFTDIDDKIIKKAREEKVEFLELSRKYEAAFLEDVKNLGLKHADITPRATEHIPEMINMIRGLLEKGYAYSAGGDVFFSVDSFTDYGKLSGRSTEQMRTAERIEENPNKKNQLDFVLWKSAKPDEPYWDSPFGKGRPGWHLECSVMSEKYLGFGFDIHGGGRDLIFPHHENEIAQSEAFFEKKPFVKYWMHNGLLTIKSEKMAKSLGNIINLRTALKEYGADVLKLFYLSTHYRRPLDYSEKRLKETTDSLKRIVESVERAKFLLERNIDKSEISRRKTEKLKNATESTVAKFNSALKDDFNTAKAIGSVFELVRNLNRLTSDFSSPPAREQVKKTTEKIDELLDVLGISISRFREFSGTKKTAPEKELFKEVLEVAELFEVSGESTDELINTLLDKRNSARKEKDFETADSIREKLEELGIEIKDTPVGSRWSIKG